MNNIKHIHEVLFLFQEVGNFANEKDLFKLIKERHGNDVLFTSCSNQPLGLGGVVDFLINRRKIVQNPDGSLSLHPAMKMCDGHHDHDHHHHHSN